jgi:hypothetical protein
VKLASTVTSGHLPWKFRPSYSWHDPERGAQQDSPPSRNDPAGCVDMAFCWGQRHDEESNT